MKTIKKIFKNIIIQILSHENSKRMSVYDNLFLFDNKKLLFKPYSTMDCLSLHNGVAKYLRKKNNICDIYSNSETDFFNPNDFVIYLNDNKFNFYKLKEDLKNCCTELNIDPYYYSLLDEFVRRLDYKKLLFGELNKTELKFILTKIKKQSLEFKKKYDVVFIADSGYLLNFSLKNEFLTHKKKVFYLNPVGKLEELTKVNESEFTNKTYNTDDIIKKYNDNNTEIKKYILYRISGKAHNDLDSSRAYDIKLVSDKNLPPKIFLLHAFRDANNTVWDNYQIFDNYFEWVDFSFKTITSNQHDWAIKIHPSSKFYKDDLNILKYLMNRHKINENLLNYKINTHELLNNKSILYTNQGTIVLESLIFGKKTIFCGSRFNSLMGIKIKNRQDWSYILELNSKELENKIFNITESTKKIAEYNLWSHFAQKNIPIICPSRPTMAGDSKIKQLELVFKQLIR